MMPTFDEHSWYATGVPIAKGGRVHVEVDFGIGIPTELAPMLLVQAGDELVVVLMAVMLVLLQVVLVD